jgi:WD40 repeat protein
MFLLASGEERGVDLDIAYSPDGTQVAVTNTQGANRQAVISIWDAGTGERVRVIPSGSPIRDITYSSRDGKLIAAGTADGVLIWDAETGEQVKSLQCHRATVWRVAFSPDGKRLASSSVDNKLIMWDIQTGEKLFSLTAAGDSSMPGADCNPPAPSGSIYVGSIRDLAFSPNGMLIVTASEDRTLRVWNALTGKLLKTLSGHNDTVTSVAFSRDGKLIASGSDDETVKVWDAKTFDELFTLPGHSSSVTNVDFSPDGKRLATSDRNGMVRVYTTEIEVLRRLAKERVTRGELTREEVNSFLK